MSAIQTASMAMIERCIDNPPQTSVVLSISPDVAREILAKYNAENRGLKPHKIRPLIGDIQGGGWLLTGETIKFSDRRLLDGQNRLTACMESGVSIVSHVVFGITDTAFALIDTGAPRTAGDVLVCAGVENPTIIAHAIARLNTWDSGGAGRTLLRLSPNQILTLYQTRYADIPEHIAWGRRLQGATGYPTSWGTTLHYAFTKASSRDAADRFFTAWITGDPAVQQASILGRRVAQLRSMQAGNIRAAVFYAMAIKAYQFYMEGRPIDVVQIKWGEDEPFPILKGAHETQTDKGPAYRRGAAAHTGTGPQRVAG